MQLRERSEDIEAEAEAEAEAEVEVVIMVKSFLIGLTDVLTKGSTLNLENDISRRAATGGGVEAEAGAGAGALVPQVRDLQKLIGVKEERTIEVEKVVAVAVLIGIGIGIGVGVESEVEATARDASLPY